MKKTNGTIGIREIVYYLLVLTMMAGCATHGKTGALTGAGVGALAGQIIGSSTEATLIGAAVGTGVGYIIGNEMDKEKAKKMSSNGKTGKTTHQEVAPLGGTKWKVVDIAPKELLPKKFTSKSLEFGTNGQLTTRTTYPDGNKDVTTENYRVVGDTLIVNKPGYLVNAKFSIKGDEMTVDVDKFRGLFKRIE